MRNASHGGVITDPLDKAWQSLFDGLRDGAGERSILREIGAADLLRTSVSPISKKTFLYAKVKRKLSIFGKEELSMGRRVGDPKSLEFLGIVLRPKFIKRSVDEDWRHNIELSSSILLTH